MSWDTDIPIIVRTLINDLIQPYNYSDDRLLQTIAVAADYVQLDVALDNQYNVNMTDISISPDPTSINDSLFVSLVSLKTACIIDQSTLRTKASMEGIKTSLGPASLTVNGQVSAWKTVLEQGPCSLYSELVHSWNIKDATSIRAILSPFVGNKFDPRSLFSDNRGRDLY